LFSLKLHKFPPECSRSGQETLSGRRSQPRFGMGRYSCEPQIRRSHEEIFSEVTVNGPTPMKYLATFRVTTKCISGCFGVSGV
jgi:hypothetical protein